MINGGLKCYSQEAVENKAAFGIQKRAFVRQLDLIDKSFFSLLTSDKEAKWKKNKTLKELESELKETQLKELPRVLKVPEEIKKILKKEK